jgi:hypothetical protein
MNRIRFHLLTAQAAGRTDCTQAHIAMAVLGISQAEMSRIVTGKMLPTKTQLDQMAAHVGVKPEELYGEEAYQALAALWSAQKSDQAAASTTTG